MSRPEPTATLRRWRVSVRDGYANVTEHPEGAYVLHADLPSSASESATTRPRPGEGTECRKGAHHCEFPECSCPSSAGGQTARRFPHCPHSALYIKDGVPACALCDLADARAEVHALRTASATATTAANLLREEIKRLEYPRAMFPQERDNIDRRIAGFEAAIAFLDYKANAPDRGDDNG